MNDEINQILQKVKYLAEIERWQEAISLSLKCLSQDPENYQAYCFLFQSFHELKNFEKALKNSEKAISIDPENEWAHRLRSIVLDELGRKKESLKEAEEAFRLSPLQIETLQCLFFAYFNNNKLRKAKMIAEKMREIFSESEESFIALGLLGLRKNRLGEAESFFREALRINPTNADTRNNLGVAILRQEVHSQTSINRKNSVKLFEETDENKAVDHFREAIKLEPNNQYATENLTNQYRYLPYIFVIISFIPYILMFYYILYGLTIILILLGVLAFTPLFWETFKRRWNMPPEIKMLLKTSRPKSFTEYFDEFRRVFSDIVFKNWQPHLMGLSAVILWFTLSFFRQTSTTTWLHLIGAIMIFISGGWLLFRMNRN